MEACPEVKQQQLRLIQQADDAGDPEDIFPIDVIWKCLRTAPGRAAVGADQWRPHDWAALPDSALRELQALLMDVERDLRWPSQVIHNIAVFLE